MDKLKIAVDYILSAPFVVQGTNPDHMVNQIGVSDFDYHVPEIKPLLTHYYDSRKRRKENEGEVHCYSYVAENVPDGLRHTYHDIYIAETMAHYDPSSNEDDFETYERVESIFAREYESIKRRLVEMLGAAAYTRDHSSKRDADSPFEKVVWHHLGAYKMACWRQGERVLRLYLGQVDKEEPIVIVLNATPTERGATS